MQGNEFPNSLKIPDFFPDFPDFFSLIQEDTSQTITMFSQYESADVAKLNVKEVFIVCERRRRERIFLNTTTKFPDS